MPQIFHVGYRSPLVDALGWLMSVLGLAGLGLLGYAAPGLISGWWSAASLALLGLVAVCALVAGQGLLRRLEWARRLSLALLAALLPLTLLTLLWLGLSTLALVGLSLGLAAASLWALHRLNSYLVRQEFA